MYPTDAEHLRRDRAGWRRPAPAEVRLTAPASPAG